MSLEEKHVLIAGEKDETCPNIEYYGCVRLRKENPFLRIVTWMAFVCQSFFRLIKFKRKQHVLFVTNPPFVIWIAPCVKFLKGYSYSIIVYDIYPDVLIAAKYLRSDSFLTILWRRLNRCALSHADKIITISNGMASNLSDQLLCQADIVIIDNWVDTSWLCPIKKSQNPVINQLGLNDKFVVEYSGSFGLMHGVTTILECAVLLNSRSDIHFILVGGGSEENIIKEKIVNENIRNLTLFPYQVAENFKFIAAAADVSLVLLKADASKSVMPSKVYSSLAVGSIVLAAASVDSDLAKLVKKHDVGVVVAPEEARGMADAILRLIDDKPLCKRYMVNSRRVAENFYDRQLQCDKYLQLLK